MKTEIILEYAGKQLTEAELIGRVKKLWTKEGHKIREIKSLDTYIKPEESMLYYVINGEYTGSFPI